MTVEYKASYVIAVAEQLSFVAAFLGGVSATILFSVLMFNSSKRATGFVVGASSTAACGLLVAVIAAWRLTIGLHPDLPFTPNASTLQTLWHVMISGYSIGVLSLILSIGLSGWIRSKRLGVLTTFVAGVAIAFFSMTSIYTR